MMEYTLIRSRRKTIAMGITAQGLVVRAPMNATRKQIDAFVEENKVWAQKHLARREQQREEAARQGVLSAEDLRRLAQEAKDYIPQRVRCYAPLLGVTPGNITIRSQKTKWGSCSSGGNLNFNCLLMLTPPEIIDSVVVHELCHLKEMNHSKGFYDCIYSVYPDYDRCRKWLKDNGAALMLRMTGQ